MKQAKRLAVLLLLALLPCLAGCKARAEQPAQSSPPQNRRQPPAALAGGRYPARSAPRAGRTKARARPKVVFAETEPYDERAAKVVRYLCPCRVDELGAFELTGDRVPELLAICHTGPWAGGCWIYDLSGRAPVLLAGGLPWPLDQLAVYTKGTEYPAAWRIDGNYSHGYIDSAISLLLAPAEDGLHIWQCERTGAVCVGLPDCPVEWGYRVTHTLTRDGQIIFSREEEELVFLPEEIISRRMQQEPDKYPPAAPFGPGEYPETGMEERLKASLYRQLLGSGWEQVSPPWLLTE